MATTTLLAQALRQAGSFTTPSATVPASGFSKWQLSTNMIAADLADPSKSLTLTLESSSDGGNTWQMFAGLTWQGVAGNNPRTGQPYGNPSLSGQLGALVGKRVRATGTLNNPITTGVVLDLT